MKKRCDSNLKVAFQTACVAVAQFVGADGYQALYAAGNLYDRAKLAAKSIG